MSKICRYRAARRDSSGSCLRARRSGSENPQIKAIGMWQSSNRRTQRWRCRPTSCGLPDPHDCEHKVSRALTVRSREWAITSQFLGIWLSLLSLQSLTQVPTLSRSEHVNLKHTSQFGCPQMPQRQHTSQCQRLLKYYNQSTYLQPTIIQNVTTKGAYTNQHSHTKR